MIALLLATLALGAPRADRLAEAVRADDPAAFEAAVRPRDDLGAWLGVAAEAGADAVVGWLLDRGASTGPVALPGWEDGASALHAAVAAGRPDVARRLVAGGAAVAARTTTGRTLAHVLPDDPATLAWFADVADGVDLAVTGPDGTALAVAVASDRPGVVSALLRAGAPPEAVEVDPCAHVAAYEALVGGGGAPAPASACPGLPEDRWARVAARGRIARAAAGAGVPVLPAGEGWRPLATRALAEVDPELPLDDVLRAGFAEDRTPACGRGPWCRVRVATDDLVLCRAVAAVLAGVQAAPLLSASVATTAPRVRVDCGAAWVDVAVRYPGLGSVMAELEQYVGTGRVWVRGFGWPRPGG